MTFDEQKIIEKIKKLLARSRDMTGSTEGERETALRMLNTYLRELNLDIATVEAAPSQAERKMEESQGGPRTTHTQTFYGRPWSRCAAHAIADLCFCMYLYRSARVSKDCGHLFIGRTANAVSAAYLAEFVCNSIHKEGRRRQRQGAGLLDEDGNRISYDNAWFLAFAWGAAREVQKRCRAMKAEPAHRVNGSTGKDIVLADYYTSEERENLKYRSVTFPNLKSLGGGKGVRDAGGYAQGQAYGSTINLNRQVK